MTGHTASDYASALRSLLPTGRAWSAEPGTVRALLITALAQGPARLDAAANALLAGSLPGDYVDLLPEWEASLGLPDPCVGANPTLSDRAHSVRARFIGGGGQSQAFFIAYAAALGFTVSITVYAPLRVETGTVETPVYEDDWGYAWSAHVIANPGGLATAVLLCELNALKPAHTVVFLT